ncbi:hypothetical protein CLOM_g18207 [Closterium sp. NIES-68]|nr:hypothetical protein CLOM_g16490 [Closterium sp. NIES-68]GJP33681.1 hypothetical protein CLOM_g18207 [Closterium sp. NIES-68]GJP66132.1 hypothetical protein CLOP_g23044 [Closterium sp. NIES-67]
MFKSPSLYPKSPAFIPFGANDDELEKRKIREERQAAQRRLFADRMKEANKKRSSCDPQEMSGDSLLSLYQNCTRLAAENKITQKNTWDLDLIDHMTEIVMADSEKDTETNFQKASCTLEAGVKIYSTRVDSIHSETYKVLSGLTRAGDTGDDEDGADQGEGSGSRRESQKKLPVTSSTLEDNPDQINVKKLERAIVTDPLFTKTSGQFDEGGASGLLLYNLPVFNGCEIMFDSEAVVVDPLRTQGEERAKEYVDISFASREVEHLLGMHDPESWEVTPSISALYDLAEDHRWKAAVGAMDSSHDADANVAKNGDAFKGFDGGNDPVGGVGGSFPPGEENDDGSVVDFGGGDDGWNDDGCGFGGGASFPGAPEMVPAGDSDGESESSGVDDGMDTADWLAAGMGMTRLKGNNAWAGPKHWHFVKSKEEAPAAAPEPKGRKKRAAKAELIDYSDPKVDESLFQAPKALKEIQLTKAGRKVVNTLLPKDYHYDGRKFATVFMSPDWSFLARRAKGGGGARQRFGGDAGFENGADGEGFAGFGGGDDGCGNGWGGDECADPFDYGDDFDGQADAAEARPADALMEDLVPMPKKAQKIDVNYARQSKQVDVKILKDTIWVELKRHQIYYKEEKERDERSTGTGPISFDRVLHNFPADCKAAALSDISVHLCFICVLHLANEHDLSLHASEDMNELKVRLPVEV